MNGNENAESRLRLVGENMGDRFSRGSCAVLGFENMRYAGVAGKIIAVVDKYNQASFYTAMDDIQVAHLNKEITGFQKEILLDGLGMGLRKN